MTHNLLLAVIVAALSAGSCEKPSRPGPPKTGLQVNTVKEFAFEGGSFKDGRISVAPDTKVQPGPGKNSVVLMRPNGNGTTVNCFCVLEGGDCWAVSNDIPGGGVGLGCASQNCASGEEPFCFMDIADQAAGFNIRLAVAGRR